MSQISKIFNMKLKYIGNVNEFLSDAVTPIQKRFLNGDKVALHELNIASI